MPCNSEYLRPTGREEELQRAARLLVYVYTKLHMPVEAWLAAEAGNLYAADDRPVRYLCETLNAMEPHDRDALVYNARDRTARDLADWWEEHQAADRRRKRQEAAQHERARLREQARAKLSEAEYNALLQR